MRICLFALASIFCSSSFSQQSPATIHFTPVNYYREFSVKHQPVLRIQPGDTVNTESVDAGGIDKNGKRVTERGNPLTGPFYIEGAEPGDLIAVTLSSVKLNRNLPPR